MTSPITVRPVKIRWVCWVAAPVVVVFFAFLGAILSGSVGPGGGVFHTSDQVAMGLIGLFAAGVILLFTRPRVTADEEHIVIRNVIGGYDLPWSVVHAVRFNKGSSWATLELEDGDVVAMMAVQATDKQHALEGIRAIRALHAAAHAAPRN